MPLPTFSIGEIEPLRAKKLNDLDTRVKAVEVGGGGSKLTLDGGNAAASGSSSMIVDGGSA